MTGVATALPFVFPGIFEGEPTVTATIAQDVAALLKRDRCGPEADDTVVEVAVDQVLALARAYTRDRGFTPSGPNADIRAVVVTASARLVSNPRQYAVDLPVSRETISHRGGFTGWSLAELAALNRWRVRAQ